MKNRGAAGAFLAFFDAHRLEIDRREQRVDVGAAHAFLRQMLLGDRRPYGVAQFEDWPKSAASLVL